MKRKLAASIKGTPSITKFFKRSSEINSAKPVKTFEATLIIPKLPVKPISDSKGPSHNITKECKENITPGVDNKSKQKEIDCFAENKQVSKTADCTKQDESVIAKLNNLIVTVEHLDYQREKASCEGILESDHKEKELSVLSPEEEVKEESKSVSTCQGIAELDNKDKELSVLAPKRKLKGEDKTVSTCEGILGSDNKKIKLSVFAPKKKLKEEKKPLSTCEGIQKSDKKDKDLSVLSPKSKLKEENKTVSSFEGSLESGQKDEQLLALLPEKELTEENKTVSTCEGILESGKKEKDLLVLPPEEELKELNKTVSTCEGIQKSVKKEKDLSVLSPKSKLKEENKTVSSFEGSLESGQKDEKLSALLPEKELTAENKTVSTCAGIQKSNYKGKGLPVLASKGQLKEENTTISICEGIVESGLKDENLLALSPEEELKKENKPVSICEGIPESDHKEKELSVLSPIETLEKENKTALTSEKILHHNGRNIIASSSNAGLENEDKSISSCEKDQKLSNLSIDNKVRGSSSPIKELPPCNVEKTVNCAGMSTSVNADMENMTEAEVSDSQMAVVENEQKTVNVDNSIRDMDEEMSMTSSNTRSEHHDMSSEEHGGGDEDITDEESDDELLSPPAFLCDYRVKPEIKTPEKCSVPLTGSPLTPISPFVERPKDDSAKCRYSLAKLVLEKPKQVKKDIEMASLQNAIHEQIEKGRMARLAGNYGTESEDDDDDDDAILPVHQKELDKFTSKDKEFTEEMPGENIFSEFKEPVKHKNGCSQAFPTDFDATDMDVFTKSLFTRSDVEIRELLCGGWIVQRYLVHPCPQVVVQWLFHILCYHLDNHTVQASYNALWSLFNAKLTKNKQSCLSWLPSARDILDVFSNYGANVTTQFYKTREEVDNTGGFLIPTFEQERHPTQNYSLFPLVNINRVIQFLTLCVVKSPRHYSCKDLEIVAVLLWCLSLDLRLAICQHDIKTCLEAVYGAFEPGLWPDESKKLSSVIYQIVTHHRNRLHLVQMQPYSCRGRDIKRLAGLQLLASLARSSISDDEVRDIIRCNVDENEDKELTDCVKSLEKLERLLHEVLINDDTNYYEVHTMVELLDLAVGAESLTPQEKVIVERITGRLRLLYRDIKDPRAMFINRSKVKDLILRTISKFVFMAQGKKGVQRTIGGFFEDATSDLYIETLKETEEEDENIDLETERSFGASSEQGSLSPTSEASDDEPDDTTKVPGELE